MQHMLHLSGSFLELMLQTFHFDIIILFAGRFSDVLAQWQSLSNKFPANINILNGLGTAYCLNEASHTAKIKAKETFNKVLIV